MISKNNLKLSLWLDSSRFMRWWPYFRRIFSAQPLPRQQTLRRISFFISQRPTWVLSIQAERQKKAKMRRKSANMAYTGLSIFPTEVKCIRDHLFSCGWTLVDFLALAIDVFLRGNRPHWLLIFLCGMCFSSRRPKQCKFQVSCIDPDKKQIKAMEHYFEFYFKRPNMRMARGPKIPKQILFVSLCIVAILTTKEFSLKDPTRLTPALGDRLLPHLIEQHFCSVRMVQHWITTWITLVGSIGYRISYQRPGDMWYPTPRWACL